MTISTIPRAAAGGTFNAWGDHVGHTAALAALNQSTLAAIVPFHPTAAQIRAGYGTALVADFLRWTARHGVRADRRPAHRIQRLADQRRRTGRDPRDLPGPGRAFLELPNHSRYPRSAFFDTPDHLNEAAQISHSTAVAEALVRLTDQRWARSP